MSLFTDQISRLLSLLQDKIPEQKTGLAPADASVQYAMGLLVRSVQVLPAHSQVSPSIPPS